MGFESNNRNRRRKSWIKGLTDETKNAFAHHVHQLIRKERTTTRNQIPRNGWKLSSPGASKLRVFDIPGKPFPNTKVIRSYNIILGNSMDRFEFEKWYLVEVARITIRIKVRIILTPFPIWNLVLSFSLSACLEPQKPRLIPRNSLNHYCSSRENKELTNPFATSGTGLQCTGYSSFSALYHFLIARRLFLSSVGGWRYEFSEKISDSSVPYCDYAIDCGLPFSQHKPNNHPHYHNARNMLIILSKKMMANIMRVMLTAKLDEWIVEPLLQDVFLFYYNPPTPHFCISFVARESRI